MCSPERHENDRTYRSPDRCAAHGLGSLWHETRRTPMAGRRTASIAISAIAALQLAACVGDATDQTDAAATVAATATTDSTTTRTGPDTMVVASEVTAQLQAVVEETVGVSGSIP